MTGRSKIVALAIGCFVAFVGAELALRGLSGHVPTINLLATAGMKRSLPVLNRVEDFVKAKPEHLIPHRNWHNYYTNVFGFNDREFVERTVDYQPKILALGDSFVYGLVPYPQNVMTLLESQLQNACQKEVEVINAGVPGAGVLEYAELFRLIAERFKPQWVLVHFYLGNDAPDLVREKSDAVRAQPNLFESYFVRFVKNAVKVLRGVALKPVDQSNSAIGRRAAGAAGAMLSDSLARGGEQVEPGKDLPDDAPSFVGPTFSEAAYDQILADEATRFLTVDAQTELAVWRPVLEQLDSLRSSAMREGVKLVIVIYPSLLQLDSQLLKRAIVSCTMLIKSCRAKTLDEFNSESPRRFLKARLERWGIPVIDLTEAFAEQRAASTEALYIANDTHWTVAGNRLAARTEGKELAPLVCGDVNGPS